MPQDGGGFLGGLQRHRQDLRVLVVGSKAFGG